MDPGPDGPGPSQPVLTYLVDNGSLRADAWRNLAEVARRLSARVGEGIHPASLLHSDRIPPEELGGRCARTLEPALRQALAAGERSFLILPFFLGPTRALTEYLPDRAAALAAECGPFAWRIAPCLCPRGEAEDGRVADILAARVREVLLARGWRRPPVILVDHGSPEPAVTAVRDRLARDLAARLGEAVAMVAPASMERRPEPAYDFNEPLLADLLARPGFRGGEVVVARQFLSPGRHAGEGGDIERLCREAEAAAPGTRTHRTALVGTHPAIVETLAQRWRTGRVGESPRG